MVLTLCVNTSAATIKYSREVETMAVREIPTGSIEIQTGLWAYRHEFTINGTVYVTHQLYSAEGYCFYDVNDVYCDDEGNVIPNDEVLPTQRIYMQYASTSYTTIEELNANFVSVPVQDGFEIEGVVNNHGTV